MPVSIRKSFPNLCIHSAGAGTFKVECEFLCHGLYLVVPDRANRAVEAQH